MANLAHFSCFPIIFIALLVVDTEAILLIDGIVLEES